MDAFACLDLPRGPLLKESVLRTAFQARMKEAHPDRARDEAEREALTARTQELNQAYAILRDPRKRVRHLLELEQLPLPKVAALPPSLAGDIMEISSLIRKAQDFFRRRQMAETALERAALDYEAVKLSEALMAWSGKWMVLQGGLEEELERIDAAWRQGDRQAGRLAQADENKGYVRKWLNEINNMLGQLAELR